jgi:hypothetical protein
LLDIEMLFLGFFVDGAVEEVVGTVDPKGDGLRI